MFCEAEAIQIEFEATAKVKNLDASTSTRAFRLSSERTCSSERARRVSRDARLVETTINANGTSDLAVYWIILL